jgi:fatty acid desaturase
MTSPRDENDDLPDEGIRIDLPFISFRMGRFGRVAYYSVQGDGAYEQARRRVRARLGLYRHVATYFAVMAAVFFIDLITGGGLSEPVLWLAGIWGALIVWQVFNVFVFPSVWSQETEQRMIDEELRRNQDKS